MALLTGQYLGEYYLLDLIGQGGYADVYLGEHKYLKRQSGVKVVTVQLTKEQEEAFLSEAQTVALLRHPNIVQVYDYRVIKNIPFLAMTYAPYGNLRQPYGQTLSIEKVLAYVQQIASALQYVHEKKIVHRDIKPDNLLLGPQKEVLVSDFGIAIDLQKQEKAIPKGTIHYAAPEQFRGKAVFASDQYALAIVIYEWFCGHCPFEGGTDQEIQAMHYLAEPPSLCQLNSAISAEVEAVLFKALAKKPEERYSNIQSFAKALEDAYQSTFNKSTLPSSSVIQSSPTIPSSLSPGQPITLPSVKKRHYVQGTSFYVNTEHKSHVTSVAWSPDGKRIASSERNKVHIWDAPMGGNTYTYSGHSMRVHSVVWSPDSVWIASGDVKQQAKVWNTHTGDTRITYQSIPPQIGSNYPLAWSSDGCLLASASDDQPLQIWDAHTGATLTTLVGHTKGINAVAWSPKGTQLASASDDKTVRIWAGVSGDIEFTYNSHRQQVRAVAWSPDGTRLASADAEGEVHIWYTASAYWLYLYKAHCPQEVNALAWSPDGSVVASAGVDQSIQVWKATTGESIALYQDHSGSITALSWSPDGAYLASASEDRSVRIWKMT